MEYQVWTKEDFEENYRLVQCMGLDEVKSELDKALRHGREPLLTMSVPYKVDIKITEVVSEAPKSKTRPDQDPGDKGKGKVRPGNDEPVSEHDKGAGDPDAADNVSG